MPGEKGFFGNIAASIFDFTFYKSVSKSKSNAFSYLAKLLILVSLVLSIRYAVDFGRFTDELISWFDSAVGKIEIKNGEVVFDKPQPFKAEKLGFTFNIDTTGKLSEVEGVWGFLFTKNKFFYKDQLGKVNEYNLSGISLVLDKEFFTKLKSSLYWLACIFIFIGTYVISFIAKLIQALIFSAFGLFTNMVTAGGLKYGALFNIAVYALTPSIILGLFVAILKINIPYFWILYSGIYMIYIIMAIVNSKLDVSASL